MVDPIRQDLNLSDTQFSLLHGLAFALFYTLLGLPLGRLADKYHRGRIIAAGVTCWSLLTAACGLTRSFVQLFLCRMGVGVGEAALSPAAYSLLADLFPKEKVARAISVYSTGIAVGSGLALLVGGYVVQAAQKSGSHLVPGIGIMRPWQLVFVAVGIPGLLIGPLVLCLPDPPRRGVARSEASVRDVTRFIGAKKRFFSLFIAGLSIATALGHGVLGWAPAFFMRVRGWTASRVGREYGLRVLFGGAIGLLAGGWLTEYGQKRGIADAPIRVAAVSMALCAPVGVLAPLMPNEHVALTLFAILQCAYMMPWGVAGAAIQLVVPNEMRGVISALYLFCINVVGLGLGPTLVAMLSDRVYGGPNGVGASLATVAGILAPIAAGLLALSFRSYRSAIDDARAWQG